MQKRIVFTIHSIAGLVAGLFILLISVSGSILLFHDEIDRLSYPEISADENQSKVSVDSCYKTIQQYYPHCRVSHCHLPEKKNAPFIFTIYDSAYKSGNEPTQLYLHPYHGDILKSRSARNNFVNWMAILHNSFHLGKPGEWLVGFFALMFLVSLVTGVILYRRSIAAVMLFRRKMFIRKNLHQLIGVYALLFNLVIAVTGFWMQRYVFKKPFYQPNNSVSVFRPSPGLHFSMDSSLSRLKDRFPAFTGYVIYFAQSTKSNTAVYGSQHTNSFIHSKKFADAVFLDSNGHVARIAFVNEIPASDRYDIINSQVHFGQYGGWVVKIIYALFGLTGGLLGITGFGLWLKKKKAGSDFSLP